MNKIININLLSRRDFIKELKTLAKIGPLGSLGLSILNRCTGTEPLPDDLDTPFICMPPCDAKSQSDINPNNAWTNGTNPVDLVFSGYNKESGFVGYNVWYGTQATIISNHSVKNRSLVINSTGNKTIDASSLGGTSIPTYSTTYTVNQTGYIELTVNNTASGNYLYVSAYSSSDGLDSPLSNGYLIP